MRKPVLPYVNNKGADQPAQSDQHLSVLQPGFKKGRVHIIKRALSCREAASGGECGRGYPPPSGGCGGSPPRKFLKIALEICILLLFLTVS